MISLTAHGICNIIGGKLVSGPFDRVASVSYTHLRAHET